MVAINMQSSGGCCVATVRLESTLLCRPIVVTLRGAFQVIPMVGRQWVENNVLIWPQLCKVEHQQ